MTLGSLFSGIGGFELGLERAGMRCIWQSEIDPYASAVLRKHWPEVPNHGDIRNIRAGHVERPDVICGGFPCQDISNAGKRAGIDGERSGLWSEYARVIGELRPRYVIVENVSALLGRGLERVLGDLAALGFDAEWHCIPASAVGAPHRRDRLWIIAHAISKPVRGRQCGCAAGSSREGKGQEQERQRLRADACAACRGADVADADQPRLEGRLRASLRECAGERAAWEGGASAPIPDADGARCDESERASETLRGWPGEPAGPQRSGRHQWLIEPDVGRVAHGVPSELDRGRYAQEEHAPQGGAQSHGGRDVMPSVRHAGQVGEASPRLLAADIGRGLVSAMSRQGGSAGRHAGDESDEAMRALRERLPADAQQEARAMQPGMPVNRWPHERGEALGEVWWTEPDVGRVAHGVASRVDRLRCLGNSIVPQVAEVIGRAVMRAAA